MRRELVISTLDQGLTSAFSLALSLAFIALATPDEFGRFAIVQAALMAAHSLQGPLVLTPANLLLPGREQQAQQTQLSMLSSINALVVVGAAILGAAAAFSYIGTTAAAAAAAALFAFSVIREYSRTVFFARSAAVSVLAQDAIYVAVAAAAIAALWGPAGPFLASLAGMAAGSLVSWVAVRPETHSALGEMRAHLASYRTVWRDVRWSLMGALQTEAQTRGYLYITEAWRGAGAVGMLQAGRLLLSPLSLAVSAWSRVARPAMVAAFHHDRSADAFRILGGGLLGIVAMTLLYGGALSFAWPWLEAAVFGDRYGDMSVIVFLWWVHAGIYCLNGCLAGLVQARNQFRRLALIIAVSAGTSIAALGLLSISSLPTVWALYALIGGEALMLAGLGWAVIDNWLRLRGPVVPFGARQGGKA